MQKNKRKKKLLKDILPKFSVGLSPMDEISNKAYRRICKMYGADVLITEFISCDALIRDVEKSFDKASFSSVERPLGIQIFGNNKEAMVLAAQKIEELHPDFIDINWGCPMKKIAGKGSGSGILNDIPKMIDITKAIVNSVHLPVSVKTRIGYDDKSKPIVEIAERLQDVGIELLTVHGRTKMQMYKGEADWSLIGKIKENPRITIPIFGNGDINSAQKMIEYKNRYNVDGILIGRAAVGNPFIFQQCKEILNGKDISTPSLEEKITICKQHLTSLSKDMGEERAIILMKKFYSRYFLCVKDFKAYKMRLMEAKTMEEVFEILDSFFKENIS